MSLALICAATSQKVPSILAYRSSRSQWGFQVNDLSEAIRGFKLLLDENQKFRYKPTTDSDNLIRRMTKTPVDVSSEYLQMLVAHAKHTLERRFGSALRTMDFQYILTVPAVWSGKAKDATLQAACAAGHSAIQFVPNLRARSRCSLRNSHNPAKFNRGKFRAIAPPDVYSHNLIEGGLFHCV